MYMRGSLDDRLECKLTVAMRHSIMGHRGSMAACGNGAAVTSGATGISMSAEDGGQSISGQLTGCRDQQSKDEVKNKECTHVNNLALVL